MNTRTTRTLTIGPITGGVDMTLFSDTVAVVGEFYCETHGDAASLANLTSGVGGISACCDELLDRVEQRLRN